MIDMYKRKRNGGKKKSMSAIKLDKCSACFLYSVSLSPFASRDPPETFSSPKARPSMV